MHTLSLSFFLSFSFSLCLLACISQSWSVYYLLVMYYFSISLPYSLSLMPQMAGQGTARFLTRVQETTLGGKWGSMGELSKEKYVDSNVPSARVDASGPPLLRRRYGPCGACV